MPKEAAKAKASTQAPKKPAPGKAKPSACRCGSK
jgi:hypothetical protein